MRFEQNLRSSAAVGEANFWAVMRESVSTQSLQRGVLRAAETQNRFNGFYALTKTAEAVRSPPPDSYTPLKRGVNDKMRCDNHLVCEMFRLAHRQEACFGPQMLHVLHQVQNHFDADEVDAADRAQVIDTAQDADSLVVEIKPAAVGIHDWRYQAVFAINRDQATRHVRHVLHGVDRLNRVRVRLEKLNRVGGKFSWKFHTLFPGSGSS
jgi:hypothetical protein